MLTLAYKNLLRRRSRTLLAMSGLVLGVAALVTLMALVDGVYFSMVHIVKDMQGLTLLEKGALGGALSRIDASYEQELLRIAGVSHVVPQIVGTARSVDGKAVEAGNIQMMYSIYGIKPRDFPYSSLATAFNNVVEGRTITSSDKHALMLSEQAADKFNKRAGSTIRINGTKFTVVGIFSTDSQLLTRVFVTSFNDAQDLLNIPSDSVSLFYVLPEDPAFANNLKTILKFKYGDIMDVLTAQDLIDIMGSFLDNLKLMSWIVAIISAVVAGIGILNTFLMSVIERTKEIGVLRATGWQSNHILELILSEALLLGIFGGIVGIILGVLTANVVAASFDISAHFSTVTLLGAFIFAIFVSILASLYPAYRASSVPPVVSMRYG